MGKDDTEMFRDDCELELRSELRTLRWWGSALEERREKEGE